MLVVLPPSESKHEPSTIGRSLVLEDLSFPELNDTRRSVLDALVDTSRRSDALARLQVGPSIEPEVLRNVDLRTMPTRPAAETYAGPLYEALGAGSWPIDVGRVADRRIAIVSALFGVLRPSDGIPSYRMHVCSRLVGMPALEGLWRPEVGPALDVAADGGLVVDLRATSFLAMGRATGGPTVVVRTVGPDGRSVSAHASKVARGEITRHLVELDAEPGDPGELADALASRWASAIVAPDRDGRPWTLAVRAA